jgi:hypothetical protein
MFAEKFLGDADVLIRDLSRIQGTRLLVESGFDQIRAVQRTIDANFAFLAAAQGADLATNTGTVAARLPRIAYFAFHGGRDSCFLS